VEEDPRVTISAADRAARRKAINELGPIVREAVVAQRGIQQLRQNMNTALESWKRPAPGAMRVPENVQKAGEELLKKIDEIYPTFGQIPTAAAQLGAAGPPAVEQPIPITTRLTQVAGAIESVTQAPSARQLEDIATYGAIIREKAPLVLKLVTEDLANLNKLMREANLPYINPPAGMGGRGGGRPPQEDNN
jgi:hypothetical protein